MNDVYIYHHLGLGDHIICNALVRELSKGYDDVKLFCKHHNKSTVKNMYLDDKRIEIIGVKNDQEVRNLNKKNIIKIGFEMLDPKITFDESFYKQYNIPFSFRWSKFKINRNIKKEKELFDKYNIKENEYCFIHDDPSRGYNINMDKVNTELKIIRHKEGLTENVLDFSYILENAKEIHCMDSSFRLLADSINLKTSNLNYHVYVRGTGNQNISKSKNNWKKII